jgi:hypothetical protein
MKKWIRAKRNVGETLLLDSSYEQAILQPPHLKVQLFPHQRTVVAAMIDLENVRKVSVNYTSNVLEENKYIETNAGMLTEKLGSGKSYEILAIISLNKQPRKVSEISNIASLTDSHKNTYYYGYGALMNQYKYNGFALEVRRMYRKNFKSTLIFVGKQVLLQWLAYINENTTFSVYIIENVMHLKQFYDQVQKDYKYFDQYDIILVKNGKITGEFEPEELKNTYLAGTKVKYIMSVFSELFKSYCFARVVLDDFDTLEIPKHSTVIPAYFTWFVSRTSCTQHPIDTKTNVYYTLAESLFGNRTNYNNIWSNRNMLTTMNIQNTDAYINSCMHVGLLRHHIYRVDNPDEKYINMIGALQVGNAQDIMQMINGDALQTAAETVGICSTSVADIFSKILGNNLSNYKKHLEIAQYIAKVHQLFTELPDTNTADETETETETETNTEKVKIPKLEKVKGNLMAGGPLKWFRENVLFQFPDVKSLIDTIEEENTKEKDKYGAAIDRVKSCIKDKECPLCAEEFNDEDVNTIILKCCGLVVCNFCIGKRMNLQVARADNSIETHCPRCREKIGFGALIFVSKKVNLDDIISDNILDEQDHDKSDKNVQKEKKIKKKVDCMIDVLENRFGERFNCTISGIATSERPLGEPTYRKFLIFACFPETLAHAEEELERCGYKYLNLHGTAKQNKAIVDKYLMPADNPDAINILLINGAKYCAGLNLQNTTDVIFLHRVIDRGTESQLIGRGVRIGRQNDLRVHWILYNQTEHQP